MNAIIKDRELFATLKPLELASYLRLKGWHQESLVADKASVWTLRTEEGGEFEVLLPLRQSLADFPTRMLEVFHTLGAVEKRSELEILEDLATSNADIIRPRLPGASQEGTLPLDDGVSAYQHARNLMLAAACAAISPKPLYAKNKPEQAMEYVRNARFGPSKRGSYILTIISPVPPVLQAGQNGELFNSETEPFERRTVRVLAEALDTTAQAVQEAAVSGSIEPLKLAVAKGVSANLCESIVGLHQAGGERGVEFCFSWSPSRHGPPGAKANVLISADSMPFLQETSRVFRQSAAIEGSVVIGSVWKLERTSDDKPTGKVTVVGTAEGEPRTVRITLPGDLHALAIRAYQDRIPVSCVGELVREGQSWTLRNPRDFTLLNEEAEPPQVQ